MLKQGPLAARAPLCPHPPPPPPPRPGGRRPPRRRLAASLGALRLRRPTIAANVVVGGGERCPDDRAALPRAGSLCHVSGSEEGRAARPRNPPVVPRRDGQRRGGTGVWLGQPGGHPAALFGGSTRRWQRAAA